MNDRELMNKAIDSRLVWDEVSRRMVNAGRRLQAEEDYGEWESNQEAARAECDAIDREIMRRAR